MTDTVTPPSESPQCCRNCGLELSGRYCRGCSQDSEEGSPGIKDWIAETFSELTSVEGRSLHSLRLLLTRPGALTVAWREGKRVRYTRPLRLVLVALVLLLLVRSLLGLEAGFFAWAVLGFLEGATAGDVDASAVLDHVANVFRGFTIALIPTIAGIVSLFFRKRTFSEHFVFTLHVVSFALFLRTLFSFVELISISEHVIQPIQMLAILGYAYMAMSRVYGESLLRTLVKFVVITVLSVIIWIVAGVAIISLALELG